MNPPTINQQLKQVTNHLIKNLEAGGIQTVDLLYYNNVKNDLLLKQRVNKHNELLED